MAKKSTEEMKQLIDLGKEKGFLTYDEVNDLLPSDIVSAEQIDDVMSMFGEMDIEVVDSVQKVKIPKVKLDLEEEEEAEGEQEEQEYEPGALGRTSDPVRMYLREMGSVSLLTREGKWRSPKRIEEGEKEVAQVILNTPITVKEVIQLGSGSVRVRSRRLRSARRWRRRSWRRTRKTSRRTAFLPPSTRSARSTSGRRPCRPNWMRLGSGRRPDGT